MNELTDIWKNSAIEEKLLWLYTALMPFLNIFFLRLYGKKIICADLVFAVLFIILAIKYFTGKINIRNNYCGCQLLIMIALFFVSFINSVDIFGSFIELLGLVYLCSLFIAIINIADSPLKLNRLLYVYFFTSGFLALIGLLLFFTILFSGNMQNCIFFQYGAIESMAHHFPRLRLTFDSPNMPLVYWHVSLIVGAILFFSEKTRKNKLFILLICTIILAAAFITGSRRFAGLMFSLFIILCWYGRHRFAIILKYLFFLFFILFLIAAFVTSIWIVFPLTLTNDKIAKTVTLKANYAYSIHNLLPAVAINMFKKHPFLGAGFGTFNLNFKENVDWAWLKSSFSLEAYPQYIKPIEDKTLNFDPHSLIFGVLAETGLLGFLGLLYFLFHCFNLLMKRFKYSADFSFDKIVGGCVLAGFIGMFLNAITLDILSMRHFWFMLAIGLSSVGVSIDTVCLLTNRRIS